MRCYSLDTDLHTSAEAGDPGSVSVSGLRYPGGQGRGQPVYPVLPPGLYMTQGGQPQPQHTGLLSGDHPLSDGIFWEIDLTFCFSVSNDSDSVSEQDQEQDVKHNIQ